MRSVYAAAQLQRWKFKEMIWKCWCPVWSAFREQADLLITMSSGMTIVSLQMNCRFLLTSCVIHMYVVRVPFPFQHQHIMHTWLPSEPGIIWWIKNMIGEWHHFELLQNRSWKELDLFILGVSIFSFIILRVNLSLALNSVVEKADLLLCFYSDSEFLWCF